MTDLLDTYIENRERVQPTDANNYGTAHGGNVTKWMDEVGALSAMRFAGETCVTASIDQMDFERPIPVGETTVIRSYVYEAGRTSVKVNLEAYREEPRSGERKKTTESYFVFVAVDEEGKPQEVPELTAETERAERLRRKALDGRDD
ncbi:acyl-CoA thioesterase [Halolamina sp. CBA1230]|uniref:acyl-CoA thioesterase n=1 Tax=Halolamina sp. CBA1230 TaxID=1853690 RepID=UPI0009A1426A|nr:acyl-CoA thioesterase [Halolamina sp. CBA1230]QKY21573.1 acyl-CoA thioesterase [Halolamina sp. CBA1230]